MTILKNITLPNGVVGTHHKIVKIESVRDGTRLQAHVASWANQESYETQKSPIWNEYIEVPTWDIFQKVEDHIFTMPAYIGGTKVTSLPELETARINKWNNIKTYRDKQEYGGFIWNGSPFDSDPQSQSRIQGGVQLAILAQQANQPFSITWTLQDNTSRVLNGDDMIAVGQALAAHVQNIHTIGRVLREELNAATTVEEINSIVWPV